MKIDIWAKQNLQKEIMLLSNLFSNKLDNLISTLNKEDVFSYCQTENAISSQWPGKKKNRVVGNSQMQEEALEKNRVTGHVERKERVKKKNEVIEHFERKEEIKNTNGNMFEVSFLD